MTSPAELRVSLWGRPVKPMALGIIIALLAVALNGPFVTADSAGKFDWPLSIFSTFTLAVVVTSWVFRSQGLFEVALMCTAGLFTARAAGIVLLTGNYALSLLPLSVAVLAGGSYVLERADDVHLWGR